MNPFNRPTTIIALIVVIGFVVGGIIAGLQLSKRTLTIELVGDNYAITVYEGKEEAKKALATIESTQKLSVHDGYYCYVVNGDNYSNKENCFSVYGTDTSVKVEPLYSDTYLAKLLPDELAPITSVIQQNYGNTLGNFENVNGKLLNNGEWYIGVLKEKIVNPGEVFDTYVYILHKSDGSWKIAAKPSFVISAVMQESIPKDVIDSANKYLNDYTRSFDY